MAAPKANGLLPAPAGAAAGLFAAPKEKTGGEPPAAAGRPTEPGDPKEKVGAAALPPTAAGLFLVAALMAAALNVAVSAAPGVSVGGVTPSAGELTPNANGCPVPDGVPSVSEVTPKPVVDGLLSRSACQARVQAAAAQAAGEARPALWRGEASAVALRARTCTPSSGPLARVPPCSPVTPSSSRVARRAPPPSLARACRSGRPEELPPQAAARQPPQARRRRHHRPWDRIGVVRQSPRLRHLVHQMKSRASAGPADETQGRRPTRRRTQLQCSNRGVAAHPWSKLCDTTKGQSPYRRSGWGGSRAWSIEGRSLDLAAASSSTPTPRPIR